MCDIEFSTMFLARLANVAHNASEGEVRRLLEQVSTTGEERGWNSHGIQALFRMIEFNENTGALQALLARPELDVNYRNKENLTPLHVAAAKNREYAVKLLMERKDLDVNATAEFDLTPLHLAARLGHTRVLKQLFNDDDRLFLHSKTTHDFCALHLVAEGDEENLGPHLNSKRSSVEQRSTVVRLLRAEQERRGLIGFEHFKDVFGRTALHYAAMNGYVEMVRELLEYPHLNPNAVDNYGLTPLHLAVKKGHISVSCLLIQAHNIDLNCKAVFRHVRPQVPPLQYSNGSYMMHLFYPSMCDDNETYEIVNAGVTPLHIAAGGSHAEILRCLLESKCVNLHAVDFRGFTALHFAVMYGDIKVVKLLMDQPNVNLNCCDGEGLMPLLLAVERSRLDVVKFLLGDVTTTMPMPEDKLHISIKLLDIVTRHGSSGNGEIAHYLIDYIEDSVKNSEGNFDSNLVHWAVKHGNAKLMVLILFWRPEDANITNKKKETPLHLAILNGQTDLVSELCREQGWQLRAAEVDKAGAIPLDYAFDHGKEMLGIQRLLLYRQDVKEYVDRVFRYEMNTINALFVGAALFASITYVAWLQPPLGFVENYNFPMKSPPAPPDTYMVFAASNRINVKLFFIFNTISFVFSLVTIFRGVEALWSDRKKLHQGYVGRSLRQSFRHCYWYFAMSTSFIIAAFEQASKSVLAPGEIWYISILMYVIWVSWGILCLVIARKPLRRKFKRWRSSKSTSPCTCFTSLPRRLGRYLVRSMQIV